MQYTYSIKIKGEGTPTEIKNQLAEIIGAIEDAETYTMATDAILDGAEWGEEGYLETEISQANLRPND